MFQTTYNILASISYQVSHYNQRVNQHKDLKKRRYDSLILKVYYKTRLSPGTKKEREKYKFTPQGH